MKRNLLIVLFLLLTAGVYAQKTNLNQLMQERNEYYFTFELSGNDNLQQIAHAISIDRVDGNVVTAYANNEEFANFQKLGYNVTLQTPPSMLEKAVMWDGSNRAAYDWDAYPTYEAYESMMFQFATDHPDKCEIITLGTLASNRKILIAHINNGSGEGKPKFLYTSTIHGDETTGWMLMLRLIDYILENPTLPECANVLENIDLYIGPNTNPDGTFHGGNSTVNGATRYNVNGVDMNRNYADPHGGPHPDGHEYQLETQWFMQFAQDNAFVMGANYHGGEEVMNYPWDNTYTLHADDAWYQLISHEYADLCHQVNSGYMTAYNNGVTNGAQWYMIGGGRQDYMNGYAQCREMTIECSNTKCPSGSQMPSFWNINKNSMFTFMNQCLYGIHGTVTDQNTKQPLEATITITGHDDEYSVVGSHLPAGDFHRPIKAGTYTLTFTANGYYPHQETVTVADGETVELNVQLEAGEGILPDFTASTIAVSLGGTVNFTDQTWGANLVSWEWTFEGGTPSTSTAQNPTGIRYNEVGDYDVTLAVTNANGQTETVTKHNYISVTESYNMQNTTITTCSALFYDDGGPNLDYGNNMSVVMTFLPETPGGILEVIFNSFNVENNYDFLYIYDGTSTTATQIGQYTGNASPGTVTATNEAGALTFKFTSDGSLTKPGWDAVIHCTGITYEPLVVEVIAQPEVIEEGTSSQLVATVTGGDGEYTYLWEPAETLDNPNISNPVATPTEPETVYKVTITDGQGTVASGEVTVSISNWALGESNLDNLKVYPNPTKGVIRIEGISTPTTYRLFNSTGQIILEGLAEGDLRIEPKLSTGVYFMELSNSLGVSTRKIVVE
ncbi:MAG: carboxypeptidase regulatory-like domain-containing protein [Bacteroidales bacterium]|nr:carboxypeptidase regulatory-like domain-containing protein [Bacteroidales bacterium]